MHEVQENAKDKVSGIKLFSCLTHWEDGKLGGEQLERCWSPPETPWRRGGSQVTRQLLMSVKPARQAVTLSYTQGNRSSASEAPWETLAAFKSHWELAEAFFGPWELP